MSASRILNVCHLSGKKITNRLTGISINKLNKSVCDFEQKREASTMATCLNNINPQIKLMEYAVRGPLVIRATEIEKELANVSIFFFLLIFNVYSLDFLSYPRYI